MAKKLSKECREEINSWLNTIQEGDCARVCNGEIVITNSIGCEINRINMYGYTD